MAGERKIKKAFESSVNPEGIQTKSEVRTWQTRFESSVNPEGIQTRVKVSNFSTIV